MVIRFRPHHFMCSLGFQGKGYSDKFVDNYQAIVDKLRAPNGDEVQLEVAGQADDICSACPNLAGERCLTQEKINHLDNAHSIILGLKVGECLTWGEAKARIKKYMSLQHFEQACHVCTWKSLGVCEQALKELLGKNC